MTPTKKEPAAPEDPSSLLMSPSTRILPREQLQLIKGGSLPRVPDCFQRVPKKVALQNNDVKILAIMVDGQGVHAIVRNDGSRLSHRVYNLSTGKVEVDSKFPTDVSAFLGLNPGSNISFHSTGESEFVSMLMDGNQTIYPLVKDQTPSADSIKDPMLLDLPPIQALGLGTHALPHIGNGKKNEVAVIVLSFVAQLIMPKILQCDFEAVKRFVASLEADPNTVTTQELIQAIMDERCDGGRNIFHAAVSMCQPTSNKDSDQDVYNNSGSFASSFDIEPSLTSRAMNLREMMRRAAAATPRFDVSLSASGSGSNQDNSSPVLRPAPGSIAAQEAAARIGLAPPGDNSVVDEAPAAASALNWPHQAAEAALEAASASAMGNQPENPADVDSLLGKMQKDTCFLEPIRIYF